jgi:fatty acid desaturase
MSEETGGRRTMIGWYRTPLDRETLARLNQRSDAAGWVQVLGHLSLLALTFSAAFWMLNHGHPVGLVGVIFLHGMISAFSPNGVHELVHRTVFKTRALNDLFLEIFSFLGWNNYEMFHASHLRHHQYTLHRPDDLEVVLPIRLMAKQFFKSGFVNPWAIRGTLQYTMRVARGEFVGEWELALFPPDDPEKRRAPVQWARKMLIGHALILVIALRTGLWLLPVMITLAPFYGSWLFWLCNNTQHVGLMDDVTDFRLCCRTFTLNPVVQFLYWYMNFHIEHHMYAAVPCYNLVKLHEAIKPDLPPIPHGLVATWREIGAILRKQQQDPSYQYTPPVPARG